MRSSIRVNYGAFSEKTIKGIRMITGKKLQSIQTQKGRQRYLFLTLLFQNSDLMHKLLTLSSYYDLYDISNSIQHLFCLLQPSYNKDDFFDTISCNQLDQVARSGQQQQHTQFPEHMRQVPEVCFILTIFTNPKL